MSSMSYPTLPCPTDANKPLEYMQSNQEWLETTQASTPGWVVSAIITAQKQQKQWAKVEKLLRSTQQPGSNPETLKAAIKDYRNSELYEGSVPFRSLMQRIVNLTDDHDAFAYTRLPILPPGMEEDDKDKTDYSDQYLEWFKTVERSQPQILKGFEEYADRERSKMIREGSINSRYGAIMLVRNLACTARHKSWDHVGMLLHDFKDGVLNRHQCITLRKDLHSALMTVDPAMTEAMDRYAQELSERATVTAAPTIGVADAPSTPQAGNTEWSREQSYTMV